MLRRVVVAAVALAIAAAVRAQTRGAVDWIFLVDTSASMRGAGKAKNIFSDVQSSLKSFIAEASDGDTVTVMTFDRDVRPQGLRDIHGKFDREELSGIVDQLEANGKRTHLGAAIAKGLERSEALVKRNPDRTRQQAVVLFTDGKEDVREIANPIPIPSNVERAQRVAPWIFFVSMGEHETKLDDFVKATRRSQVLHAKDPESIRKVAQEIRTLVEPPPAPPPPLVVKVDPAVLDLGTIEAGRQSQPREITVTANRPTTIDVRLANAPGVTMQPHEQVSLIPNRPAHLRLEFAMDAAAAAGARTLTVQVGDGATLRVLVAIAQPSLAWRIGKWAGAIALLLLLVLGGLVLYTGKMPGELLAAVTLRNALEGEIEIVKPRLPPDASIVGLPPMKKKEVVLSAFVPADALSGSDARLFCRRSGGEKKMWIAAEQGSLRVNDVEVPLAELYDADTIRIGDAVLRFSRIGYERPQEDRS